MLRQILTKIHQVASAQKRNFKATVAQIIPQSETRKLGTILRKILGRSHGKRWQDKQNFLAEWNDRTERIAQLIQVGTSVIEFGAGKLLLKDLLPQGCSYTPSDLFDRGYGTIVCDLNGKSLPSFPSYDVAVFSGVLEYIYDVPRLILHLSNYVDTIIASYAILERNENRRVYGWVNDFSAAEFIEIFENSGFSCDFSEPWNAQMIYQFTVNKKDKTLDVVGA